ncbi:MAG TPA: LytTR family DNA-binding domain-containing protein [Porticoccaceae bacterium]|nr:LytTR family DNA-binding domain-containing protein [Porticoccaceae bacterium]
MKVLIVDDEPLARERLGRMVLALGGFRVVGQASHGQEAVRLARELSPEVVFMDVRMPGMDGLAAAQHLAELDPPPAVIFCTAYGDYAVEAFSSQAVGYLLKPVRQADLAAALNRARRVNKAQLAELRQQPGMMLDGRTHITSRSRRGMDLVPVAEVALFQADHKYVTAYHGDGESLLDETLRDLEQEFDGRFLRIHRNALISVAHIEGLERDQDGQFFVRLRDLDIKPQVSRRHIAGLRKLLDQI